MEFTVEPLPHRKVMEPAQMEFTVEPLPHKKVMEPARMEFTVEHHLLKKLRELTKRIKKMFQQLRQRQHHKKLRQPQLRDSKKQTLFHLPR
jgi:hypothetical protein